MTSASMQRIVSSGRNRVRVRPFICVAGGALVAWLAVAQQGRRVDNNLLRRPPAEDWTSNGRDYAETHYSPLNQINASNVGRLGLAWYWDTDAAPGLLEGSPLVINGALYGSLTWSVLYAVDARTGKFKWRWDPEIPRQNFTVNEKGLRVRSGPSICCGPVNRGVAMYQGRIYAGLLDGSLVALDAETGRLIWRVQTTNKEDDYSITGAPRIVKGKVIIGNSGAEFDVRGYVSAYDAETGKLAWRFYTVPGDPSLPFENKALEMAAKTWTGAWWKYGGGGTVWDGMAFDPDADLLYIGTGNGSPWNRDLRSPGGGDNLFLACILALRPETGELVWHYQVTPGDNWDFTATQPLMLAELPINGRSRKVIMQAAKNGFFFVLDRITGEFISAKAYAQVTWATGVDPKTGRPIETPQARYGTDGSYLQPGPGGAHNWQAMSWNPSTGLVYIPGQETRGFFAREAKYEYQIGRFNTGRRGNPDANAPPPPPIPTASSTQQLGGFLVAWDPVTQTERWRVTNSQGYTGGTVSTAGNLVFHGSAEGHFIAYSADKGEKLWDVELAPSFSNPVSYMVDGKQYISVLAGRGASAGPGRLYTFTLDGKTAIPALTTPKP
jgi:quinohemoprotein ethanol dehydrogenase